MDTMLRPLATAKRAARVQSSRQGEKVQESYQESCSCMPVDSIPEPQQDPPAEERVPHTFSKASAQHEVTVDLADTESLGKDCYPVCHICPTWCVVFKGLSDWLI